MPRGLVPHQRSASLTFSSSCIEAAPVPCNPRRQATVHQITMDEDLEHLSPEQLVAEIKRLRAGIRQHRDSTKHELCWHHPQLWGLLPEKVAPGLAVPEWPQFLRGCLKYRESLDRQLPDAPRTGEEFDPDRK